MEMYKGKWKKGSILESVGDQPEGGNVVQQKEEMAGVREACVQIPAQPVSDV